uniref:Transmembrane protein n=1 Tax=Pithovirus LCPAC201 TaxID=2506591 RepID=A0A481Z5S3_9VIRU|nr:MAG: hypothetical protein LCPAC201_00630 [Pithovirus LCPAC201]
MVDFVLVVIIIIVFVIIIILTVVTIVVIKQEEENSGSGVIIDPKRPCVRSTNQLIDVSQLECCCLGGQQTDLRYIKSLDAVVSPGPTYYLDACAGFCENGNYNPVTETCRTGSSTKFTSCANMTKPVDCDGTAMPVAVVGIEFFYIHSATKEECVNSAACAPDFNVCPAERFF